MPLDRGGKYHCGSGIGGRPVRHRQNGHARLAVVLALDGERDHKGPDFATCVLVALRFVVPETGRR